MYTRRAALLACALASACVVGDERPDAELEAVRDRVQKALPEIGREGVQRSPAPGLFEVRRGLAFAYTPDGRYLLRGDLVDLESGLVLSEITRREVRAESLRKLGASAVEFAPKDGKTKHTVFIYADVDCHYCRALHREVSSMNALGIAVRYLFYPRAGERSPAFKHAQSVYCAPDPRAALDTLFSGRSLKDGRSDCDNPVAEQLAAALALGVKGTPMMILPDGRVLYGPIGADALFDLLEQPELTAPVSEPPPEPPSEPTP